MKTIQEINEERNENQYIDACEMLEKMLFFIPMESKHSTSVFISAKFCAKVACDYLYDNLPNMNDTPPNSRNDERTYRQYWRGVKLKLEELKP